MLDTGDLDGGHRGAWQRGEKDAPQRVAQGGTKASLQRLHYIFAIGVIARNFLTFNAGLLDFYHVLPSFFAAAGTRPCPYTAHQ